MKTKSLLMLLLAALALIFSGYGSSSGDYGEGNNGSGGGGTVSCNGKKYDQHSQFCSNGAIVNKEEFTDSRDQKVYKYVTIGDQAWMAENLSYKAEGSVCYGEGEVFNGRAYYSKEEVQKYCATYGRLYDQATAKEACPSGWHLPTKEEWEKLIKFVGGAIIDLSSGTDLKAKSGWGKDYDGKSDNGEDIYGFTALPGGEGVLYNDDEMSYLFVGGNELKQEQGEWWAASDSYGCEVKNGSSSLYCSSYSRGGRISKYFFSVRCVKD